MAVSSVEAKHGILFLVILAFPFDDHVGYIVERIGMLFIPTPIASTYSHNKWGLGYFYSLMIDIKDSALFFIVLNTIFSVIPIWVIKYIFFLKKRADELEGENP